MKKDKSEDKHMPRKSHRRRRTKTKKPLRLKRAVIGTHFDDGNAIYLDREDADQQRREIEKALTGTRRPDIEEIIKAESKKWKGWMK